ncbi:MAG: hypothetical protein VB078_10510 [Clostridiaceae bacterium]|nr:hypothetical protein [Clostridiaceae bacterium]
MVKTKILEYLKGGFDKYKYVLIVCLFGLALAFFPSYGKSSSDSISGQTSVTADLEALEAKLEAILSKVSGVGRVEVVLTAKSSSESVYAYNEDKNMVKSDGTQSADTSSSLATLGSSSSQAPVTIRVNEPQYRGAFIVCDGAESAKIRLEVTQAVASLTGITSDNIVISKMEK